MSAKKLYAIDLWSSNDYKHKRPGVNPSLAEAKFDKAMEKWLKDGADVVKLKMDIMDALPHVPDNSLDILYVDAEHSHEAVIRAANEWLCKIKPGGFLSGHDFSPGRHQPVVNAVKELAKRFGPIQTSGPNWMFQLPGKE